MNLEVLVSTYKSRLFSNDKQIAQLKEQQHIIIDQSPNLSECYPDGLKVYPLINSVGLTKNRNEALKNSCGDLILISDDDVEYIEKFDQKIIQAFKEHPEAAAITFQVLRPDGEPFKSYKSNVFFHTKRSVISTSSVELVFRREVLEKHNLKFDESFGVNAKFPCGEEAILLGSLLDLGEKVLFYPASICIHPEESSGKDFDKKNLLLAKGAMIRRLFGAIGFLLIFAYILKNFKKIMNSKAKVFELFQGYFTISKSTF